MKLRTAMSRPPRGMNCTYFGDIPHTLDIAKTIDGYPMCPCSRGSEIASPDAFSTGTSIPPSDATITWEMTVLK
jgi:hypothetical protein